MSLFVVGTMAAMGVLVGLVATLAEQVRVEVRRRRSAACEEEKRVVHRSGRLTQPVGGIAPVAKSDLDPVAFAGPSLADRAVAYRNILDALGDDLDRDIAEWEAVLEEFPQVLLADDELAVDERAFSRVTEETCQDRFSETEKDAEKTVTPKRSRRVDPEECGQIVRLSNTGFAPEEIALWLNLPLERVQELLNRP